MREILFLITLIFGQAIFSQNCESLKNIIILESNKQLPVLSIEYSLESLKNCGLDDVEIEIITNQTYFVGTMMELIKNKKSDIKLIDYLNSYLEFKKTDKFKLYYDAYKDQIRKESMKITSENINEYENIWNEKFGVEQANSMVDFLTKNNFISSDKTYKQGIKEYYLFKHDINPYEKNLAGIVLRNN